MADAEARGGGPYTNGLADAIWAARVTIAELGRRVEIDRPRLSQLVNGWMLPGAIELDAICAELGVDPASLYGKEFLAAIEATRQQSTEAVG